MKQNKNYNFIITIIFSSIVFSILYLNLPNGFISGGDWTFPFSEESFRSWETFSTWNSKINFGDSSVLSINALYYKIIVKFLYFAGIPLDRIQAFIIIFFFIVGQIGFVYFFKYYLNLKSLTFILIVNIFSLLFIFSPPNYNFLLMGWIMGSISYLLYPFFILFLFKSQKNYTNVYCFLAAIIFSFSIMQIHTILWYLLMSFVFLFDERVNIKKFVKNYFKICFITIFLNIHWIIPLIMDHNYAEQVLPAALYRSAATKGMDLYLNFFNVFKFHGSLFNEHFETWIKISYPLFSVFISIVPIILLLMVSATNKVKFYKYVFAYVLIIAVVLIFININKENFFYTFSYLIPFRHLSRLIIIFPFLIYFLITCMLITQFESIKKFKKTLIFFLISLNLFNLDPWIQNLSYEKEDKIFWNKSFKLREFNPQKDYINFFKKLEKDKEKFTRSLFFPYGALIHINNDPHFSSGFMSIVDIFSKTSPIPGAISVGSGRFSNSLLFIENNFVKGAHKKFEKSLIEKLYTVDLFIYRKNVSSGMLLRLNEFKNLFKNNKKFKIYYESPNILVYERIKKNSLIELIEIKKEVLDLIIKDKLFYFSSASRFPYAKFSENKKKINFNRINDSIIYIDEINKKGNSLLFNESYSLNWCKLSIPNYKISSKIINNFLIIKEYFIKGCAKDHYPIFDYANVWITKDIDKKNIVLIFKPQIGFILSLFIYSLSIIFVLNIFLYKKITYKKEYI